MPTVLRVTSLTVRAGQLEPCLFSCAIRMCSALPIRSHRQHTVHKTQPSTTDVARSVVCVSICLCVGMCVGFTGELCKTVEPIEMTFEALTSVGLRNHILHGGQDRTKPFGAAMRPFAKLLWILVISTHRGLWLT